MAQTAMTVRLDSGKATKAFQDIRREAQKRPELTLEEINAEINAVREAKANKV